MGPARFHCATLLLSDTCSLLLVHLHNVLFHFIFCRASEKKECLMCRAPLEEEVEAQFDDDDAMDDDGEQKMKGIKKNYSRNMELQAALVAIFPGYDNDS